MSKAKRHSDRETVRYALQHAILERESYLDAILGCRMEDAEAETRARIDDMKRLLMKRYGELPVDDQLAIDQAGAPRVTLGEILRRGEG